MRDPLDILMTAGALLLMFLAGYVFKKFSKNQDENTEELKRNAVSLAEIEMNGKRQDSELREAKRRNEAVSEELKKECLGLAKDMRSMTRSISNISQTTTVHSIEIANLKDENKIIADQLRKNAS